MTRLTRQLSITKNFTNQAGFSLVELLVTIGIIAVLGTITIAVVGNIRQSANKTQSMSNLRQIGMAMKLYSNENEGKFPPGYFYKQGEGERIWMREIQPFIEMLSDSSDSSDNIFVSPLAEIELKEGSLTNGVIPSTYSAHGVLCPDISNEDTRKPIYAIPNPSDVILLGEANLRENTTYAFATFRYPNEFKNSQTVTKLDESIPTDESAGGLSYRANGATLVTFVDGHVEAMDKGTVTYRNVVIAP